MEITATAPMKCPHCQREQEDGPAGDYVVAGRVGEESRAYDDCVWCDQPYSAIIDSEGIVHVTAE